MGNGAHVRAVQAETVMSSTDFMHAFYHRTSSGYKSSRHVGSLSCREGDSLAMFAHELSVARDERNKTRGRYVTTKQ